MIEENCNTCEHGENTDVCPLGKCAWSPNYTYKEGRRAGIEEAIASDRDWDYFAGKLSPKLVYDGDKTEKYIRETILRQRKDGSLTKEEARSEWNLFINSEFGTEFGFYAWYLETTFSDAGEMAWHRTDFDAVQFVRKCMGRLIPLLKADLEKEASCQSAPK